MAKTWVLVAHRAGAKILEGVGPGRGLAIVREIEHEPGRKRDRDINSDRPGRTGDDSRYGRTAYSSHESAHDHVAVEFAKHLAQLLDAGRNDHRFERIVLVAEPTFLGMIREALAKPTLKQVVGSVTKDLQHASLEDVTKHVGEVLAV